MVSLALGWPALVLAAASTPVVGTMVGPTTTLIAGVADAQTGAAIVGAEVYLPELGIGARTGSLGEARLGDIPAGRHLVRVRFLGYAPAEVHLQMQGDTVGAVFRLERVAVPLDAVQIRERWVPIRLKDFEIRRNQAIGRFLVDEEIEKIATQAVPLAVSSRFPGLRAFMDNQGHWHIASTRDYLNVSTGVSACEIQSYLDDMPLGEGDLDILRTADMAGIEYYSGLQVPVRYRTKRYGCGVLLLWSRWK